MLLKSLLNIVAKREACITLLASAETIVLTDKATLLDF